MGRITASARFLALFSIVLAKIGAVGLLILMYRLKNAIPPNYDKRKRRRTDTT